MGLQHLGADASKVLSERQLNFPNRLIDITATQVQIPGADVDVSDGTDWAILEQTFIDYYARQKRSVEVSSAAIENIASISGMSNFAFPTAIANALSPETFQINLLFRNPLHATLRLTSIILHTEPLNADLTSPSEDLRIVSEEDVALAPYAEETVSSLME